MDLKGKIKARVTFANNKTRGYNANNFINCLPNIYGLKGSLTYALHGKLNDLVKSFDLLDANNYSGNMLGSITSI